ncbi:D-isomer specific 2-hydroxyacid dehydrogenase [Coniochaeta sp. 2T2.1]|nr:D-isomer specific 2-hydroxyacid dehydrogenase [Coniochaeta sp. 2T2.1]
MAGESNGTNGHSATNGTSNGVRPKVLQLGVIEHANASWSEISQLADIITPKSTDRPSFLAEAKSGAFDGCVVAYRTFESFDITGKVDEEMLSALPPSLRYICHNGAGYDQVDVPACTARQIRVSNTPTAVDDATADIGIFLMLGALRNLAASMASLRAGQWRGKTLPALGHDPQGKTLGILGMGGIGRNFARKAVVFGMRIRYYNRTRLEESVEREIGAEYVDFDTLLRESDVLSLNLPLNDHTRRIISRPQFAQMKTGVVIVNTARGAVMDEAALVEALDSGHVYSVGLDVYEEEPKVHQGLIDNPRVLLVPHMGTWTEETQAKMEEWTISNVRKALAEGRLRSIVPEQKHLG